MNCTTDSYCYWPIKMLNLTALSLNSLWRLSALVFPLQNDVSGLLAYSLKICMSLMQNKKFRNEVLRVLVKLYMNLEKPDFINVCQVRHPSEAGMWPHDATWCCMVCKLILIPTAVSDIPGWPSSCEWYPGEAGEGGQPFDGISDLLWLVWKCEPAVLVLRYPEPSHRRHSNPCCSWLHKHWHCANKGQRQVGFKTDSVLLLLMGVSMFVVCLIDNIMQTIIVCVCMSDCQQNTLESKLRFFWWTHFDFNK